MLRRTLDHETSCVMEKIDFYPKVLKFYLKEKHLAHAKHMTGVGKHSHWPRIPRISIHLSKRITMYVLMTLAPRIQAASAPVLSSNDTPQTNRFH